MKKNPQWHKRISAPKNILDLYRTIASLQSDPGWVDCHVHNGALNGQIPVIKFKGKVVPLPYVLCLFMGLPYVKKSCTTEGCCNPHHYTLDGNIQVPETFTVPLLDIEEYREVVTYIIDSKCIRRDDQNYQHIRPLIPVEDVPDEALKAILGA